MNIIVKKMMSEFIKDYEIEETSEAKQFEYFSTYCIVENKFDEEFSPEYVIGDGGDHGIDGILVYCNGEIVTDLDQAEDLITRNKKLMDSNLYVYRQKLLKSLVLQKFQTLDMVSPSYLKVLLIPMPHSTLQIQV